MIFALNLMLLEVKLESLGRFQVECKQGLNNSEQNFKGNFHCQKYQRIKRKPKSGINPGSYKGRSKEFEFNERAIKQTKSQKIEQSSNIFCTKDNKKEFSEGKLESQTGAEKIM